MGEAAAALGVSVETLRRWDRQGKVRTMRDSRNYRMVPASEIRRLAELAAGGRGHSPKVTTNRLPGVVRSIETGGVMALVELEAGPFQITAAITKDSVEDLALAPGVPVTAVLRATSVMVARD
jgi:molybdopterin-binding protein